MSCAPVARWRGGGLGVFVDVDGGVGHVVVEVGWLAVMLFVVLPRPVHPLSVCPASVACLRLIIVFIFAFCTAWFKYLCPGHADVILFGLREQRSSQRYYHFRGGGGGLNRVRYCSFAEALLPGGSVLGKCGQVGVAEVRRIHRDASW